jgi:hypothetical protein
MELRPVIQGFRIALLKPSHTILPQKVRALPSRIRRALLRQRKIVAKKPRALGRKKQSPQIKDLGDVQLQ